MTTIETDRPAREDTPLADTDHEQHRRVWDWPVRFFHWSLVAAFVGAFVTNKLGVNYFVYHVWCGYTVIVLVVFRILWGFVGATHARFSNFLHGPVGVLRYMSAIGKGRRPRYPGHNPLGALMVVTLLGALGAQAALGLFANDEIYNFGPLYGFVDQTLSLRLTAWHQKLFYWIAAAIAAHVAAVLLHVVVEREPLIRAMITGRKPAPHVAPEHAIDSSRGWLAVTLLVAVAAVLAVIVSLAPVGDIDVAGY
jgi:cytochrome b